MQLDELKLGDLKSLQAMFAGQTTCQDSHWKIGQNYFIRTVTHHLTGRLVAVTNKELVLEDAAWIADDGRFAQALEKGILEEIEPFPDGEVIVGRGSIIDASRWKHPLPRQTK